MVTMVGHASRDDPTLLTKPDIVDDTMSGGIPKHSVETAHRM